MKASLASLFYSSPCALCIVDACAEDQPVVYVNETFEQATGYQAAEVLGKNCRFLQAPPGTTRRPSVASAALRRCRYVHFVAASMTCQPILSSGSCHQLASDAMLAMPVSLRGCSFGWTVHARRPMQ